MIVRGLPAIIALAAAALAGCGRSSETERRLAGIGSELAESEKENARLAEELAELKTETGSVLTAVGRVAARLDAAGASDAEILVRLRKARAESESLRGELSALRRAATPDEPPEMMGRYDTAPVARLLEHKNSMIRRRAADILKELGHPGNVGSLIAAAKSGPDSRARASATEGLGNQRGPEVEKALVGLASDPDREVRGAAYRAIGRIASASLKGPLLKCFDREASRAASARYYSREIRDAAEAVAVYNDLESARALFRHVKAGTKSAETTCAQVLAKMNVKEMGPEFVAWLKQAPEPKKHGFDPPHIGIIRAIQRIRAKGAQRSLMNLMSCPRGVLEIVAADALEVLAAKEHVPDLCGMLSSGVTPEDKPLDQSSMIRVILLLKKLGDPRAAKPLLEKVQGDNERLASLAAQALEKCVDPEVTEGLLKALASTKSKALKSNIEGALRTGGYPVTWDQGKRTFVLDPGKLDQMRRERQGGGG